MLGAGSRVDRLRLRLELIASQWGPRGVTRHPGWGWGGRSKGTEARGRPSLDVGGGVRAPPNVSSGLSQAPSLVAETAAAACWVWLCGISKVNVTGVALTPTESTVGFEGRTLSSKPSCAMRGSAGGRKLVEQERRSPWGVRGRGLPGGHSPCRDRAREECSRQKEQSG